MALPKERSRGLIANCSAYSKLFLYPIFIDWLIHYYTLLQLIFLLSAISNFIVGTSDVSSVSNMSNDRSFSR